MPTTILTATDAAWAWPTGVSSLTAELLGGGGAGGGVSNNTEGCGGGGHGGSYVRVTITKGGESTLNVTVGAAGTGGAATGGSGGVSSIVQVATTVALAPGGTGGVGGTTNTGFAGATAENGTEVHTGGVYFAGGDGGTGNLASNYSGGGGGAAGPTSGGGATSTNTAGTRGTGTWADGSTTRNTAGAAGILTTAAAGGTASNYGGGGSGGYANAAADRAGGSGGAGIVVLTYTVDPITATLNETLHITRVGLIFLIGVLHSVDTLTPPAFAGAPTLTVSVSEQLHVSDDTSLPALQLATGALTETLHISDTPTPALQLVTGALTEALHITEAPTPALQLVAAALSEALHISDTPTAALQLVASVTEALHIAETAAPVLTPLLVSLTEDLHLTDVAAASIGLGTAVAEALHIGDTVTPALTLIFASVTEALHVTDTVTASAGLTAVLAETLVCSDGVSVAPLGLPNPIAYWPFDEGTGTTAADSSGNGHTGTIAAAGGWTSPRFGTSALNCTGTDRALSFTDIAMGTVYSVAGWINWNEADDGVVVGGPTGDYAIYLDATTLYHSAGGGANFVSVAHDGVFSDGWHHLVVTRSGTAIRFYKDGAIVGTVQTLGTDTAVTYNSVGAYATGAFPITAAVDDLRLYNVQLSGADVAALYALDLGGDLVVSSLAETLHLTDSVAASITPVLASVTETLHLTETIAVGVGLTVGVSETLHVADAVESYAGIFDLEAVHVADADLTVERVSGLPPDLIVSLTETLVLTETVTLAHPSVLVFIAADTSSTSATITIPTHNLGDMIVVWAWRTNASVPTKPATWTEIRQSSNSGNSMMLAYLVADGTEGASVTFTGASHLVIHVYRNQHATTPVGASGTSQAASSTTLTYPALTLTYPGESWVVGFGGLIGSSNAGALAPTGMTNRAQDGAPPPSYGGHDTNAIISTWTAQTTTADAATGVNRVGIFELHGAAMGGDLTTFLAETLIVADTVTTGAQLVAGTLTETLHVTETATVIRADQNTLTATPSETLVLSDTLTTSLALLLVAPLSEALHLTDNAQGAVVDLGSLTANPSEQLRITDTVTGASLSFLQTTPSETLALSDTITGAVRLEAGTLIANPSELLVIVDTVAARLDLLNAAPTAEALHISDTVAAVLELSATVTETLHISDPTPGAARSDQDTLVANPSEALHITDTVTAVLPVLVAGTLTEALHVSETASVSYAPRTGTLTQTLANTTVVGTGTVLVSATGIPTLGALTVVGTGAEALAGTTSAILGALTSTGAAGVAISGSLVQTLLPVTVDAVSLWRPVASPGDSHHGAEFTGSGSRYPTSIQDTGEEGP